MRTKVKICGVTRLADALAAVEAGADALGFMFFEGSKRHIAPAAAAQIILALPPFVAKVGVFANASVATVRAAVAECGLDTLQFHGEETPEFCRQFVPIKVVKAFRIQNAESLKPLPDYAVDAWLLDSYITGQRGGTGEKFNWDLACQAKELGRLIGQSAEYQAVKRTNDLLGADKTAMALLEKMEKLRQDAAKMIDKGENPSQDMEQELDRLLGEVQTNPTYQRVMVANENFDKVMTQVNQWILDGIRKGATSSIITLG